MIDIKIFFNYIIINNKFSRQSDLVISFSESSVDKKEEILFIVEIAFSWIYSDVIKKLKTEVSKLDKKVRMALLMTIHKDPPYHASEHKLDMWEIFKFEHV